VNLLISAFSQSDPVGKCIFLCLFALSVTSWALIIYKGRQVYKSQKSSSQLKKHAEALSSMTECVRIKKRRLSPFLNTYIGIKTRAYELLKRNHSTSLKKELGSTLTQTKALLYKSDIDHLQDVASSKISEEIHGLEQHLYMLSTIYSLAPFVGLLGTVWGILIGLINLQGSSDSLREGMLSGLSTALATTVLGLVIAIPALIAYTYFKNSLDRIEHKLDLMSTELIGQLEMHYRLVNA
jgi:biopolymer transport protein TolQ